MVNFSRILKTSLNLFIYKLNQVSTEDLAKNTTLSDQVITEAIQQTDGDMCKTFVDARLKLRSVVKERTLQLI